MVAFQKCQKAAYPMHKRECRPIAAAREAAKEEERRRRQ